METHAKEEVECDTQKLEKSPHLLQKNSMNSPAKCPNSNYLFLVIKEMALTLQP